MEIYKVENDDNVSIGNNFSDIHYIQVLIIDIEDKVVNFDIYNNHKKEKKDKGMVFMNLTYMFNYNYKKSTDKEKK